MSDTIDLTQSIKTLVRAAIAQANVADADRSAANDVYTAAREESASVRVKALITVSDAAFRAKWESELIETAVEAVKAEFNPKDGKKNTSVNTFASELRNAMRPGIRGHVGEMFDVAALAWGAEADADDKPLREAFKRRYHMVVGKMFALAQAGEAWHATALHDAAMAVIRERELDYTKVHGRLKAIRAQLEAFAKDFPVEGITACVEFLGEVDVKDLKACVKPEPKAAPEPKVEPAPKAEQTVPSLDDAMADMMAA